MAPRETANNAYAKFWDDKQKVLWCVVVFSGVVNWRGFRFAFVKDKYLGVNVRLLTTISLAVVQAPKRPR